MDAGDEAAERMIQYCERFGLWAIRNSPRAFEYLYRSGNLIKNGSHLGSIGINPLKNIASFYKDTRITQMPMESVEMAQMKKIAICKVLGFRGGDVDIYGSHLWFTEKVDRALSNERKKKKVEVYIQKLQKDPELFEREWEKYGHDKTSFNDKVITFNSPEEAVAAKYVYENKLNLSKKDLGNIACLGNNLFITKAILEKIKNPFRNRMVNNATQKVLKDKFLIDKLVKAQEIKENKFLNDLGKEAEKLNKTIKTTGQTKKFEYKNIERDAFKSNSSIKKEPVKKSKNIQKQVKERVRVLNG